VSGIDLTLSSIDAALADTSVSHDAMRSIPEPEAVALHLGVDNTIAHVPLRPGQTLKDLYAVIDCRSVDCVQLNDTYDMWIDDEGLYTGRMNILATALARVFGRGADPAAQARRLPTPRRTARRLLRR